QRGLREGGGGTERPPGGVAAAAARRYRGQEVSADGDRERRRHEPIDEDADAHEHPAASDRRIAGHAPLLSPRVVRGGPRGGVRRYGVGPPWKLHPLRAQPRHDVRDLLIRDGSTRQVPAPVRLAEIRTAGDDAGAEPLTADQREKRAVCDRAPPRSPLALRAVTGRTVRRVRLSTSTRIARRGRDTRRRGRAREGTRAGPRPDPAGDHVDLGV